MPLPFGSPSLTGSECGAPSTHAPSVSIALGQLRFGVLLCCWVIGFALMSQITIWAVASFTDWRYHEVTVTDPPLIVQAEPVEESSSLRSPLDPIPMEENIDEARSPIDPNRVPGQFDRVLSVASQLASGIGTLAALVLLPLMALGVLLAASSATQGVEKTVSAFGWALVVGLLVLPIGGALALPWEGGGLWSYAHLSDALSAHAVGAAELSVSQGNLVFYGRYLLLPLACVIGIALVGLRYSAGVRAGLLRRENLRVDPALEQEAGNTRAGTLHGGRTANAMRQAVTPAVAPSSVEQPISMRPIQQGLPPKRLI